MTAPRPVRPAEERLRTLWGEIVDLSTAGQLLGWDQETYMPSGGGGDRATTLGTIAGLQHRLITAPALRDAVEACADEADDDATLAAQVREARRTIDRAIRVPESLARAIAEAESRGTTAWQAARKASDFAAFAPALEALVRLKREEAAAILPGGRPYDALLDLYEPGATEAWLEPLFRRLEETLAPRVRTIVDSGLVVDESPALGQFAPEIQERFGREMASAIGFDFERGRLDKTAHPFCVGMGPGDVRLTWRYEEGDFRPGLFGILHEAGHGLYEQGLPADLRRAPIGEAVSLGVHESQSRLWENHVGRSRGFWRWAKGAFESSFPASAPLDVDALWAALHTIRPSLIRVEADEATYNLHVVIRFEIERRLVAGDLAVDDLPEAWDAEYERVLGIRADNAADGVLQDVHWSHGLFGYFPTYTLGTMAAAQLFATARRELGDLESAFARGDFGGLLDWLRQKIHVHGSRYEAKELIERATGRPLSPDDLLEDLRSAAESVYGVS